MWGQAKIQSCGAENSVFVCYTFSTSSRLGSSSVFRRDSTILFPRSILPQGCKNFFVCRIPSRE
jgi:hypothetical protein